MRAILAEHASRAGWRIEDFTQQTPEQITAERVAAAAAAREAHVSAFLAFLPQLPRHSLALIAFKARDGGSWDIQLELRSFLGEELFAALRAVSQQVEVSRLFTVHPKRGSGPMVEVAGDERILRALLARGDISFLRAVEGLSTTQSFDDGITHLRDAAGNAYIGQPWERSQLNVLNDQAAPWQFAEVGSQLHIIRSCEELALVLLGEPASSWGWAGGSYAVAVSHESSAAATLAGLHLEEWFRAWVSGLLVQPVRRRTSASKGWNPGEYDHSADTLLKHFGPLRQGALSRATDLAELLGWSSADVEAHREQIEELKRAAATAKLQEDRANAASLAAPLLDKMKRDELATLAGRFGVSAKRSDTKAALIAALLAAPAVCEDVIGLAPFLK